MYKKEEVEDSIEFCEDIKTYYETSEQKQLKTNPYYNKKYVAINQTSNKDDFALEQYDRKKKHSFHNFLKEMNRLFFCIVIAILLSKVILTFVGQRIIVEGVSMENTLHNEDSLIINKFSYRISNPERFDVIVFPHGEDLYIKRIIGLPGEKVQIIDGSIYIDHVQLVENYGDEQIKNAGKYAEKILIGEEEYFVLGDNRNNSMDSRIESIGLIKRDIIFGKACIRIYPFESIGMIK